MLDGSLILGAVFPPMKENENGLQFDIPLTQCRPLKVDYLVKMILCPGRKAVVCFLGVECVGEE